MNGSEIFPVRRGEKITIPLNENNPKVVVTDGYHFTPPLELVFHRVHTYYFKIVCIIDDSQLVAGVALIIIFTLLGLATGFIALKIMSLFPVLYFLFFYYINRKEFLQLRVV